MTEKIRYGQYKIWTLQLRYERYDQELDATTKNLI